MQLSSARALPLAVLPLSALAACSGGSGGGGPAPVTTPLAQTHTIDGQFAFGSLPQATTATLEYIDQTTSLPSGKTTTVRWVVQNDDRDLYLAFQWNDATHDNGIDLTSGPTDFDGVMVLFDVDGDGTWEAGENACTLIAANSGSLFVDQHASAGDTTDQVGDGTAWLTWDAGTELYEGEILIPMLQDASNEDGVLSASTRFTFLLYDHVQPGPATGSIAGLDGIPSVGAATGGWDALPYVATPALTRPQVPTTLTGLIAFVSTHEDATGDVYTFDPSSGVVTRVTNLPSLHVDNVSLSHDRTKVAFHGTPDPDDGTLYEIYTANVDGTGLLQLTSNAILDGHPAWSPADDVIAYASFRQPGAASIVLMDTTGTELDDLTPMGVDDNDPEFLSDGRIVFKTDRFSTLPEVTIAVMDADGTNVMQVTSVAGVSDHDPVGAGVDTLFERFLKDTNFATDPDATFTPWDIVEARLDGTSERTLVDDVWVNWLPLQDPSGLYMAHLRSPGYTELRLRTRDGADVGRLLPGITRLRYVDWK